MALATQFQTSVTRVLKIRHPVLLAGMGSIAKGDLVAAVSNAGGLGVMGGAPYSPEGLRREIAQIKSQLDDPTAFGVDLMLPQVGGSARKTNYDLTGGKLAELIDVICESGARLFVCAVGVPPRWAVDRLHAAGVLYMNMVGHPHHVDKALALGVDLICAQGTEAGGHTGEITTLCLVPQCVARCRGRRSPAHGGPVPVVAAGGITDGRGLAAALALGAEAVWVGTRFVASKESTASPLHKKYLLGAGPTDTLRTIMYTGRPNRMVKTPYVASWVDHREAEIKEMTARGVRPWEWDQKQAKKEGRPFSVVQNRRMLMGQGSAMITDIKPAGQILEEMVSEAVGIFQDRIRSSLVARL